MVFRLGCFRGVVAQNADPRGILSGNEVLVMGPYLCRVESSQNPILAKQGSLCTIMGHVLAAAVCLPLGSLNRRATQYWRGVRAVYQSASDDQSHAVPSGFQ